MLFMPSFISYRGEEVIKADEHQPRNGFTNKSSQMFINIKEDAFLQSIMHSYSISSNKVSAKSLIDSTNIAKL